jgi:hypothetical protein
VVYVRRTSIDYLIGIPPKKWRQRKDKVHLRRRKEHVPKAEAEL